MKGIILAGGSGSRLYPLTKTTSKQLLPVHDKPMIYYPLANLMGFGVQEILIISTPQDTPNIERLFGNGEGLGLKISYKVQDNPNGIAEAFTLGEDFIAGDPVCLILGDNIFYMGESAAPKSFMDSVNQSCAQDKATVLGYHVSDPERFGVVGFDKDGNVTSIEEKPKNPKSNYAVTGLYFYPPCVVEKAKNLAPSARGELEITDLNEKYLQENKLNVLPMKRGSSWLDAGTPESLLDASNYVAIIEKRQGLKIACIEEIAYRMGFISRQQFRTVIDSIKKGVDYRNYLEKIYDGHEG